MLTLLKTLGQLSFIFMILNFVSWGEGQSDLYFMVQWFCLISWRLFDGWTSYLGNGPVWHRNWPHYIHVGQWPIFHGPVILSYILKTIWWINVRLGIIVHFDSKDYEIYVGQWLYISWSSDFVLYFEDYFMDEYHFWDNWSVWHKDRHKIYVGQWHTPVILPCILKTICWINFVLGLIGQCGTKIDVGSWAGRWCWVASSAGASCYFCI